VNYSFNTVAVMSW